MMRQREAWKYVKVAELLEGLHIQHSFEYPVESVGIFDLAFPGKRLLVEFDGPEHKTDAGTVAADVVKNTVISIGWELVRIPVDRAVVIPISALNGVLHRLLE